MKREHTRWQRDGLFLLEARIVGRNASRLLEDVHKRAPESLQEVWRSILQQSGSYAQTNIITLIG
jgi:hypothetical protein